MIDTNCCFFVMMCFIDLGIANSLINYGEVFIILFPFPRPHRVFTFEKKYFFKV